MNTRNYNPRTDYETIGTFLIKTYSDNHPFYNWLQPRWEYMHFHPFIKKLDVTKSRIWETDGEIIGIIHPEHTMGKLFLQVNPLFSSIRHQMLSQAEQSLYNPAEKTLSIQINPLNQELESFAMQLGYCKNTDSPKPMLVMDITSFAYDIKLPSGYKVKSVAEDDNLFKISRVIHRGFNHPGEPPAGHVDDIAFMQTAPNSRKELNIIIESPDGDFASYCGIWFESTNKIAYVEPVTTDPSHRRMGLGKIAVLEAISRCAKLGATKAFVGSGQQFYKSLGFKEKYIEYRWTKDLF